MSEIQRQHFFAQFVLGHFIFSIYHSFCFLKSFHNEPFRLSSLSFLPEQTEGSSPYYYQQNPENKLRFRSAGLVRQVAHTCPDSHDSAEPNRCGLLVLLLMILTGPKHSPRGQPCCLWKVSIAFDHQAPCLIPVLHLSWFLIWAYSTFFLYYTEST